MAVEVVGEGPAYEAVQTALSDVGAETTRIAAENIEADLAVVVADSASGTLRTANRAALDAGSGWIAVEIGGIGGEPLVDAAIAGFGPDSACYECLVGRVAANNARSEDSDGSPAPHLPRYAGAIAGRAAAEVLDGSHEIFGAVHEVPDARRTILPLPNCSCDEGSPSQVSLRSVDRSLDAALERAERGLDDRVGVVAEVGEVESLPAPYYLARVSETAGFSDASAAGEAAGVDSGWDAAFMKALGEAYERYAAGVYRLDSLPTGPPGAVNRTIAPGAFVCATTPTGEESIRWVNGIDLHDETQVRLPAEFVHYPPATERFRPPITTGLGFGNGGAQALLSGLYEVVERDATMLSWYSTFDPLGLEVEDEGFDELAARADVVDLDVECLLVTQDIDVPVVAVGVKRERWPRLALGSAANLDPTAAARSALTEALQNWMELRAMGPDGTDAASGAIGEYAADPALVQPFLDPDTVLPAASVGSEPPTHAAAGLETLIDRLDDANLRTFAAATTTRDLQRLGFEAVRALIPSAQPLFFQEPYFGERATSVPESLGYEPVLDRAHHPFP